jgi:putative peptidoglycan lipid II flippase
MNENTDLAGRMLRLPKGTVVLSVIALVTVLLGFAREATVAYFFGATTKLDAFLVAFTLPQFLAVQCTSVTASVLLPEYMQHREHGGYHLANALMQQWFWFLAKVIGGTCLVLATLAPVVIILIGPGLTEQSRIEAAMWLRWLTPYLFIMTLASCFKVVLEAHRIFAPPALAGALISITVIFACLIGQHDLGIGVLPFGLVAGSGLAWSLQWWHTQQVAPIMRSSYNQVVREMPTLPHFGVSIMTLNAIAEQSVHVIDRAFATMLPEGSVAALNYADAIIGAPTTVISSALATTVFPVLASLIARGDWSDALDITRRWVFFLAIVGLMPVVGIMTFSQEIVSILFERGQFNAAAVSMTATALTYYASIIILSAISTILIRLLLSQRRWRVIAWISLTALLLKLLLNLVFVPYLGIQGITLATVLAATIGVLLRYYCATQAGVLEKNNSN